MAVYQFTGGTTGLPKAAKLTQQPRRQPKQLRAWVHTGVEGDEKMLMTLPTFHVYGMTVAMLLGMDLAAEVLLYPTPGTPST